MIHGARSRKLATVTPADGLEAVIQSLRAQLRGWMRLYRSDQPTENRRDVQACLAGSEWGESLRCMSACWWGHVTLGSLRHTEASAAVTAKVFYTATIRHLKP